MRKAGQMTCEKTHPRLLFDINLRTEFSETVKEAKAQALGQAMKACEAAGTSFFGGKFKTEFWMRVTW